MRIDNFDAREFFSMKIGIVFFPRDFMLQPMQALVPCGDQMDYRQLPGPGCARHVLIPLRYAEDWRTLAFLALLWGLFFVQWTGLLRHWVLLAATCVLSFVACIVKHNHIHCAVLLVMDWKATLVYFAIPWIFGQWGNVTINLLQHQDCKHDSEFDHSRNITGPFANWLFLNNGFHTAHHLRPALHWSRLPDFHRQTVELHIRPDLNHRSMLACVWNQFFRGTRGVA